MPQRYSRLDFYRKLIVNIVNNMLSGLYAQAKTNPEHKHVAKVKSKKILVSWQASSTIILMIGVTTLAYVIWYFNHSPQQLPPAKPITFSKPAIVPNNVEKSPTENITTEKSAPNTSPVLPKEKEQQVKTVQADNLSTEKFNKPQKSIHKPAKSHSTNIENHPPITKSKNSIPASTKSIVNKATPVTDHQNNTHTTPHNKKTQKVASSSKPKKQVKSKQSKKKITIKKEAKHNPVKKQAIKLSKQQLVAKYYAEALQKLNAGEILSAEALLKKTLSTDSKHIEARKLLAGIYINQQKLSTAETLLEEGIQKVPEAAVFYHWLGRIYMENGKFEQAAKLLLDGSKYANSGEYFALLALAQQNTPAFKKAVTSYQRALKYQPTNSKWWLGLGIVLEKAEDWEAAKEAYTAALQSENLPFVLHNKARGRLAYVNNQIALLKSHE
ncbi:MAG TPA: tetratricopeptide repeat protein [Gammaproteobacteria bacterium]|nr:tetratricopeptide repeat protein [Gammaproteobacteria bacterium]